MLVYSSLGYFNFPPSEGSLFLDWDPVFSQQQQKQQKKMQKLSMWFFWDSSSFMSLEFKLTGLSALLSFPWKMWSSIEPPVPVNTVFAGKHLLAVLSAERGSGFSRLYIYSFMYTVPPIWSISPSGTDYSLILQDSTLLSQNWCYPLPTGMCVSIGWGCVYLLHETVVPFRDRNACSFLSLSWFSVWCMVRAS